MYKVLAAMSTDMNEGCVWVTDGKFASRSAIKITNKKNNKSAYCEYLKIDDNFRKEYNQSPRVNIDDREKTIVINDWYRKELGGITTKESHDLTIVPANSWCGRFRACIGHPQVVVRLGTWLAVISAGLGVLSVGLGVLSIFLAFK